MIGVCAAIISSAISESDLINRISVLGESPGDSAGVLIDAVYRTSRRCVNDSDVATTVITSVVIDNRNRN